MQIFLKTAFMLLLCALACPPWGWTDEIVMTSGERFTTDKIWTEGDKIRFSLQGLVVSVHKDEVAAVIRGDGPPMPVPASTPLPVPTPDPIQPPVPTPEPTDAPVANPAPSPTRAPRLPWSKAESNRPSPAPTPTPRNAVQGTGLAQTTWGMAPGELPGLRKIKTDPLYGGIDQYWLPEQRLQLGPALLDGWVYNFWQDQLYSIIMWAEGRIGYERMKREIFARYGKGVQRRLEVERFVWDDDQSQRMLEYDDQSQSGIFVMRSSQVDQQIKARYPDNPDTDASN